MIGAIIAVASLAAGLYASKEEEDKAKRNAQDEQKLIQENYIEQLRRYNTIEEQTTKQTDQQISQRALSGLRERSALRSSAISSNIGGQLLNRLTSVSELGEATDIGIIESEEAKKFQQYESDLKAIETGRKSDIQLSDKRAEQYELTTFDTISRVAATASNIYTTESYK